MKNVLQKIKFFIKRPKLVLVTGSGRETAKEAIFQSLKPHFKIGKELWLHEAAPKDLPQWRFFIKKSRQAVLVVSHIGEYHPERGFFAGEMADAQPAINLAKELPQHAYLVLNYDDETVRDIQNKAIAHPLTFGLGARADIRADHITLTQFPEPGTNFKIRYESSIVPFWLERLFGKENIYAALAAASVGEILGLNLVEVSSALRQYRGVPGRMKMIDGIKKSFVLDDSANASPLSMLEALEILKSIRVEGRKIAILGDIVGVGKYTIEAHEALGEQVAKCADLLFTVGERAKFFGQGARAKGMPQDNIFEFIEVDRAGVALQDEIKPGDLVLVDGSKEMNMIEIVNEIKAF